MVVSLFLPHTGVFGGVRRYLELGNAWVAQGHRVVHLIAPGRSREHALHPAARLDGGRLCYLGGGVQRELF